MLKAKTNMKLYHHYSTHRVYYASAPVGEEAL